MLQSHLIEFSFPITCPTADSTHASETIVSETSLLRVIHERHSAEVDTNQDPDVVDNELQLRAEVRSQDQSSEKTTTSIRPRCDLIVTSARISEFNLVLSKGSRCLKMSR